MANVGVCTYRVYIDVTEIALSSVIEKVGQAGIWTNWQPNTFLNFFFNVDICHDTI